MPTRQRFRCRACGLALPAWLPVTQEPEGAMLLHHLGRRHPDQVEAYLDRMHTDDDIDPVVVEAYEVVEGDEAR